MIHVVKKAPSNRSNDAGVGPAHPSTTEECLERLMILKVQYPKRQQLRGSQVEGPEVAGTVGRVPLEFGMYMLPALASWNTLSGA